MDDMFQLLWEKYRKWADTSAHLKRTSTAWKRNVLVLTLAGTALVTLAPFAPDALDRLLPMLGAAALALATYFGKELLDAKNEEKWTRARAAAEALKSEAHIYLVQAPPYDGPDRVSRLDARMEELDKLTKDQVPVDVTPELARKGMPASWWTVDDYLTQRVEEQADWYQRRARDHSAAMKTGRVWTLGLGATAVVLSAVTGATADSGTYWGGVLAVVTTAGGSLGAYFQAGHYEALAVKYRETADALRRLKAQFTSAPTAQGQGDLVTKAEAIMRAENAAWLTEVTSVASH